MGFGAIGWVPHHGTVESAPLAIGWSAPFARVAAQDEAGTGHERDQRSLLVLDLALEEGGGAPALLDLAARREAALPDGLEEIDLELEGGERFPLLQGGVERAPHRQIRQVAEDAPVERTHRIR